MEEEDEEVGNCPLVAEEEDTLVVDLRPRTAWPDVSSGSAKG